MIDDPRYPIGKFVPQETLNFSSRLEAIDAIARLPNELRREVADLDAGRLDTPYRDGGWTVRQVVHHVADSHVNAYIRLRLALTEDLPTIKPYDEARWAQLDDANKAPPELSLALLENLHERWALLLRSLSSEDFARQYDHPETGRHTVDYHTGDYAWHGKHHTAQVRRLRQRMGW